jgi:phospholipid/cholesterol/gamma-HCH transport system substrate-binding protein
MSNEIKIGLLAIITLALFIWGYKFVEGRNIFNKTMVLYAEYEDVNGLRAGTSVMRSGVKVGVVTNVNLNPENLRSVIVEMAIETNLPIPKNTTAIIATTDFLGEKRVILDFDKPCSGADCAKSGDFLLPAMRGVVGSFLGPADELKAYIDVASDGLKGVLDSLGNVAEDENSAVGKAVKDINIVLENLKASTAGLNGIIQKNSSQINSILKDVASLANIIESKNNELLRIINNLDTFSTSIAQIDLGTTLQNVDGTIQGLNNTLNGADKAIQDLRQILVNINKGDGTLGKLLQEDDLYFKLDKAIKNVDFLLQDIRLHPERYRRVLSKKKMPYEKPDEDPAFDNNEN